MKSFLQNNGINIYSTHDEGKSVIAERLIKTLKNKIYKYKTSVSKNVDIDKLDDAVNKYNNTYHGAIKMKPINVNSSKYISSRKEINDKDLKFKVCVLLEYQNIKIFLRKVTLHIGLKMFFTLHIGLKMFLWLKKVTNAVPWTYAINDFNGEEIFQTFYEKELQKRKNQKESRIEKVNRRKGNKLYVK